MASITKTYTKTGEARYKVYWRTPDGRTREKWFQRKVDAQQFAHRIEEAKGSGAYIDPAAGKVTFEEWVAEWLAGKVDLMPRTRQGYESLLRVHLLPVFGKRSLRSITALEVRGLVRDLSRRLSPSRVRQTYMVLSGAFRAAVEARLVASSPCVGVPLPRVHHREAVPLTREQVDRIAAEVGDAYRTLVYTLAYCGTRWGETVALRRSRIDLVAGQVEVREAVSDAYGQLLFGPTKTHQRRTVVLPRFLVEMLGQHLAHRVGPESSALVFTSPEGGLLRHQNFTRRVWRPAVARAGLEGTTIHRLRHFCVSALIAAGASALEIMKQVGHEDIQTTYGIYGHLFPARREELARRLDGVYEGTAKAAAGLASGWEAGGVSRLPVRAAGNRP
jgi:integrase